MSSLEITPVQPGTAEIQAVPPPNIDVPPTPNTDDILVWNGSAWVAQKLFNAQVSATAAIAYSKLNLATSIVNADVAAGAAIAYSKLNLGTSIVNADVAAGAAIAQSKLNLSVTGTGTSLPGSPDDGDTFLLRRSSTPFEFRLLTYDATYAKWVSAPELLLSMDQGFATTSVSYAEVQESTNNIIKLYPGFLALYNGGLRAQLLLIGRLVNTGANSSTVAPVVSDFDDDDTAAVALLAAADANSIAATGTGNTFKTTGWIQPTITPTQAHAHFRLNMKVSAGTGTLAHGGLYLRWVSA